MVVQDDLKAFPPFLGMVSIDFGQFQVQVVRIDGFRFWGNGVPLPNIWPQDRSASFPILTGCEASKLQDIPLNNQWFKTLSFLNIN